MPAKPYRKTCRLLLIGASASVLICGAAASAQDWGDYPPPPGAYPQRPYAQNGYAPYAPQVYGQPYGQGQYAQGYYAPDPYAQPYDPYAAQRRAWRRQQAQDRYQQAYAGRPRAQAYPQPPVEGPVGAEIPAAPVLSADAAPPAAAPASTPPAAPPETPGPEKIAATPVAPPTAPQSVALAHRIVESASAYIAYMNKASALSAAFTDGASVAKEVQTGAAYEPKQFEEGAIAYAAIVALQEPAFVQSVRTTAGGDAGRAQQIAAGLLSDPASVAGFPGASAAAARASAALRRQGDGLMTAGTKVKQSAYDVQHSAWSKDDVQNPDVRLAGAKTLSATRLTPAREETDKLLKMVLAEQGAAAYAEDSQPSPVVSRGLALAAIAVLGQAGEDSADRLAPLLAEEKDGECLKMAKLNLFQCLAVAGPHYEDIFCLGQHAMMDTAQCVIAASGAPRPAIMTASAAVSPTAAPVTAAPQDYWVPLGGQAGAGQAGVGR